MALALDEDNESSIRDKLMALALDEEENEGNTTRETLPKGEYATAPSSLNGKLYIGVLLS